MEACLPLDANATGTRRASRVPGGYWRFPSSKLRAQYRRTDINRRPHWGWDFARYCVANHRRPSTTHDGLWCVAASQMLRRRKLTGEETNIEFGPRVRLTWQYIAAAYNIWQQNRVPRWTIEARILAGQSDSEIGLREEVPAQLVTCYAALFFDLRDKLTAKAFIRAHVLEPDRPLTGKDVGVVWAYFGLNAGPIVLQALIDDFRATGMTNYDAVVDGSLQLSTVSVPQRWLYRAIRSHLAPAWQSDDEMLRECSQITYLQQLFCDAKRPGFSSGLSVSFDEVQEAARQSQLHDYGRTA